MLPTSQNSEPPEPLLAKLSRKAKQQPLVPLGVVLTCGALFLSQRALRHRDSRLANRMFFWRVGFQGFTVAAMLGGAVYYGENKRQEKSREEKMRDVAKQREKLWIEELERIEEESRQSRERAEKVREQLSRLETASGSTAATQSNAEKFANRLQKARDAKERAKDSEDQN